MAAEERGLQHYLSCSWFMRLVCVRGTCRSYCHSVLHG